MKEARGIGVQEIKISHPHCNDQHTYYVGMDRHTTASSLRGNRSSCLFLSTWVPILKLPHLSSPSSFALSGVE